MSVISSAITETASSARLVFANPNLRRVNLALAGSLTGDGAYSAAVAIYAYNAGGATLVGLYVAIRLALMAFLLPFASVLVDRWPKKPFLVCSDLIRVGLVLVAAALIAFGGPALIVLVLAIITALVGAPFRPAQGSLLPSLADSPQELTAGNAVSSTLESLSWFVGPALAGLMLAFADIPLIFVFNALTFGWSALMLAGLKVTPAEPAPTPEADRVSEPDEAAAGNFLREAGAGFRAINADRRIRLVVLLLCAQTVMAGASTVFVVVIALDIVQLGPAGNGYLNAILGVGSIVGGLIALSRSARGSLATDFGIGVVLWSAPPLLIAVLPWPVVAFVACALIGLGNPLVDVNLFTLLQRLTPEAVLGRVLAAMESAAIGAMALGAVIIPILISVTDLRLALVIISVPLVLAALLTAPALRRMDVELSPPPTLALVAAQPLFAPLSPAAQESVARKLVPLQAWAGSQVITAGDVGEEFYLIESGVLEARRGEVALSEMGPGDCFGEIALLRDVPRTATVVAREPALLWVLEREDFLDAVGADPEAVDQAAALVTLRLAR